jgi:predicted acetyltransferase
MPATVEQEPVLANLLELYIHDFSEVIPLELGPDGRFGYPELPRYWSEPGRFPFLIAVDGHWGGFALVRQGSRISGDPEVWDLAEFFVARGLRRRGVGIAAAHLVWRRFAGRWEVRVMQENVAALHFWQRAVAGFAGRAVEPIAAQMNGEFRHLFSFESRAGS